MLIRTGILCAAAAALSIFAGAGLAHAGELTPPAPPAPPAPDYKVLAKWDYATAAEAAAAWRPMAGTAPAAVATAGGRKLLRLKCNLAGTKIDRASWDHAIQADLALARGVQFRAYCADPGPVGSFSVYLQSGGEDGGWYAGKFFPRRGKWTTVKVEKSRTRIEDKPAGWGAITGLRISAWRGRDEDAHLYLADFGVLGGAAEVAIVRGDSNSDSRGAVTFSASMGELLDEAGVEHALLSDRDVTPERLKAVKLIILPHNSSTPEPAAKAVSAWLKAGGRMLAFHYIPRRLRAAAGIDPGGYFDKRGQGMFESIRFVEGAGAVEGAPAKVRQNSWGSHRPRVGGGGGVKAVAWWHDKDGKRTEYPAIVASETCTYMSHVILTDHRDEKHRMLLALVGARVPGVWKKAAEKAVGNVGRFGPYTGYEEAVAGVRKQARRGSAAYASLRDAWKKHRAAKDAAAKGEYPEAVQLAAAAEERLLDAWCRTQKPLQAEFRGAWCHSAYGVDGMSWDEAAKRLAEAGFTDFFPNMCWGGAAYYASEVLPVVPETGAKGDQIAECLAACRRHGLKLHIWKVNWNLGGRRAPKEFVDKLKAGNRLQVTAAGETQPWLCPSHPANREMEIASMVEVARKYAVDGIHFDYIRYPGSQTCFCAGCRERFEKMLGRKVANWPADVRGGELEPKWHDFRREQITAVVRGVHERARKARPGVKISAAVFPNWPVHRKSKAQDWKMWCERGWLDFVCPMDYTSSAERLREQARSQKGWAGKVPCYPGIGLSASTPQMRIDGLIEQVKVTRELGTKGFMIFQYDRSKLEEFRQLGLGLTRRGGR